MIAYRRPTGSANTASGFSARRSAFSYDPRFETLTGSIYLNGYWQSYRYFENVAELIRAELIARQAAVG